MFTLLKNIEVYQPKYMGKKDVLICGEKIVQIEDSLDFKEALVLDKTGMRLIPGFIDQHVHVTGGGGEGGFHTRTPEVSIQHLIEGGLTTVVGVLGTDTYTRSVESLVAKTKSLHFEGLSAYCLTGGYRYPSPTLTDSVGRDITFIEEVIGVKCALSDHRESHMTFDEFAHLAFETRVASLISHKAGIVTIHVGDAETKLNFLFQLVNETAFPIQHLRPTHVNRHEALLKQAIEFHSKGGMIDLTCGDEEELVAQLTQIKEQAGSFERVTLSSDGNGSFSTYDDFGGLLKIGVSSCNGIYKTIKALVRNGYSLEEVLPLGTSQVASGLHLPHKGTIDVGKDADLILLNQDFEMDTVIAKGHLMIDHQQIMVKGNFTE